MADPTTTPANPGPEAMQARIERLENELAAAIARIDELEGTRDRGPGGVDPGDAVPEGVAVQTPLPLDDEARAAQRALESHLPGS